MFSANVYFSWLCCPLERKLGIIQKKISVFVIVRLIMVVVMVMMMLMMRMRISNLAIMMRGKTYGGTRLEVKACHKTITCDDNDDEDDDEEEEEEDETDDADLCM